MSWQAHFIGMSVSLQRHVESVLPPEGSEALTWHLRWGWCSSGTEKRGLKNLCRDPVCVGWALDSCAQPYSWLRYRPHFLEVLTKEGRLVVVSGDKGWFLVLFSAGNLQRDQRLSARAVTAACMCTRSGDKLNDSLRNERRNRMTLTSPV